MGALFDVLGKREFTAGEATDAACGVIYGSPSDLDGEAPEKRLMAALEELTGSDSGSARELGLYLNQQRDRVVDQFQLLRGGKTGGRRRFRIVPLRSEGGES